MYTKKTLTFLLSFLFCSTIFCQTPILIKELGLTEKSGILDADYNQRVVSVDPSLIIEGFKSAKQVELNVELGASSELKAFLFKENDIYSSDFELILSSGRKTQIEKGHHFSGRTKEGDLIAISVFSNEVIGIIVDQGITYELEQFSNKKAIDNIYRLVKSKPLPDQLRKFCKTVERPIPQLIEEEEKEGKVNNDKSAGATVQLYLECDYKMFQDFSQNTTTTTNYITGLMNVVFTLFSDEMVTLQLSTIKVWDTSDPYGATDNGVTTLDILESFRCNLESYTGRLAHLVSTADGLGGIADQPFHTLCPNTAPSYGFSAIYTTYDPDLNNYSWSINVLAHELGHQFSSHHTHDCVWNGNDTQIDDCGNILSQMQNQTPNACYNENAQILPAQGQGTIMSYCHTTGGSGINLALGFHDQIATRISTFANSCLGTISTCTIPGTSVVDAEVLSNTSVMFTSSIPANNGWVIAYVPSDGSSGIICNNNCNTVAGNTSITISGLDPSKTYKFQFTQYCSAQNEFSAWSCFYSLDDFGDDLVDCTTDSGTVNSTNANTNIISSANVLMTSGPVNVTSTTPITWQSKQSVQINADFSIAQNAQLNFAVGDCQEN